MHSLMTNNIKVNPAVDTVITDMAQDKDNMNGIFTGITVNNKVLKDEVPRLHPNRLVLRLRVRHHPIRKRQRQVNSGLLRLRRRQLLRRNLRLPRLHILLIILNIHRIMSIRTGRILTTRIKCINNTTVACHIITNTRECMVIKDTVDPTGAKDMIASALVNTILSDGVDMVDKDKVKDKPVRDRRHNNMRVNQVKGTQKIRNPLKLPRQLLRRLGIYSLKVRDILGIKRVLDDHHMDRLEVRPRNPINTRNLSMGATVRRRDIHRRGIRLVNNNLRRDKEVNRRADNNRDGINFPPLIINRGFVKKDNGHGGSPDLYDG